ncbi:cellulose binding domain-containing protein [Micromonospora sp. NPDC000668]|uniref:cellulose binding domain-containing protein n=1 Tax=Micromonospora sp. NPDC000668 TaxID=3364219 RepID=UPI0036A89FC6
MAVRPDGAGDARTATRVLASVPWIVVLLGVCVLVVLLVVALLSFRTREREGAPVAAPPVFLPTVPAAASSGGGPTPGAERRSASPRPSRSTRTPSPRVTTSSPAPGRTSAPAVPLGPAGDTVTARYQVGTDGRDGTAAVLSITNGSSRSMDWRVELAFDDDMRVLRVSDDSGISVSARGDGEFVLRGTRSLDPGDTRTLRLRVGWDDSAERPVRCTVNGADCQLG